MMSSDNIIMRCISLRTACQTTSAAAQSPAAAVELREAAEGRGEGRVGVGGWVR